MVEEVEAARRGERRVEDDLVPLWLKIDDLRAMRAMLEEPKGKGRTSGRSR